MVGHRQAFAWIDDWYGMTMEDVRNYESEMQKETNDRLNEERENKLAEGPPSGAVTPTTPAPDPSVGNAKKGWFWSSS